MYDKTFIFIAGVRKAGTTTLYNLLSQHPMIGTPKYKETQFFAQNDDIIQKYFEWYFEQYDDGFDYYLDGSTLYFNDLLSLQLIKRYTEHFKLIIVVRDPAKRTYSSYLHMRKQPGRPDSRTLSEILEKLTNLKGSIIEAEDILVNKEIENGNIDVTHIDSVNDRRIVDKPYGSNIRNKTSVFKYFSESIYSQRIEECENVFNENIKIVVFEDLIKNTDRVLSGIINFIGLDKFVYKEDHSNKTLMPKNELSRKVLIFKNKISSNPIYNILSNSKLFTGFKSSLNKVLFNQKEKMDPALSLLVRDIFKKEYSYWGNKMQETLKYWC